MAEEHGDSACVEAGVDGVEDGAGHGDGEMELVHGGDVGRHDRHHVASPYAQRLDGRSHLETSTVGLRPGVGDGVINNRRAISIRSSSPMEEA